MTGDARAAVEIAPPASEAPDRIEVKETTHVQAPFGEVQDRPADGREHLGPAEISGQSALLRSGPARSAAQEQGVGFRPSAARQAEAQGLLPQPDRKAVLAHL